MRKTALAVALTLIVAFLFTIRSGTKLVQGTYAPSNFSPYKPPKITVLSPSPRGTCHTPSIPLNVTVQIFGYTPQSLEWLNSLNYSLDGQVAIPITLAYPSDYGPGYYVNGSAILSSLTDGSHNLTIRGETTIGAINENFNTTISFTVDTSTAPITEFFPTVSVATACVVVTAAAVTWLLVYFKKRKR
jgi:hypothetical protein